MSLLILFRMMAMACGCMVLFAGCGSSSSPKSASVATTAATSTATTTTNGGVSPGGKTGQHSAPPAGKGAIRPNSPQVKVFQQAVVRYYECLRQHGVKIPAPNTSGKGLLESLKGVNTSSPQFHEAQKACTPAIRAALRGLRPQQTTSVFTPTQKQKFTKYTACMRQQGINMPAPNFSGKGPVYVNPPNNTTPKFRAANKKCGGLV
jgi:hypothetical protein